MRYRLAFLLAATIVILGVTAAAGHAQETTTTPPATVQIGTAVRAYGGGSSVPPPARHELPNTGSETVLFVIGGAAFLTGLAIRLRDWNLR